MSSKDIGSLLFELGFSPNYIRNYIKRKRLLYMNNCQICGKPDSEKPTCFRGEKWCCENHRKMIQPVPERKTY